MLIGFPIDKVKAWRHKEKKEPVHAVCARSGHGDTPTDKVQEDGEENIRDPRDGGGGHGGDKDDGLDSAATAMRRRYRAVDCKSYARLSAGNLRISHAR